MTAFPDRVVKLDAALRAWRATIPQCKQYETSPSCEEFSSAVFPSASGRGGVGALEPAATAIAERGAQTIGRQDSEPDFWYDPVTNDHVFY